MVPSHYSVVLQTTKSSLSHISSSVLPAESVYPSISSMCTFMSQNIAYGTQRPKETQAMRKAVMEVSG